MNTAQKVVKALAIALAIFIIFNIASVIFGFIFAFAGIEYVSDIFMPDNATNYINYEESYDIEEIENLSISSDIAKVNIITADEFKVEAKNVHEKFKCNVENGTLNILEKSRKNVRFSFNDEEEMSQINIYIPDEFCFKHVDIEMGVGSTNIDKLYGEKIDISAGVGSIIINYLDVKDRLKVKAGVGTFDIMESRINNLDFEAGVGKYTLTSYLTGKSKIECGVGNGTINLSDFSKEESKIRVEKGLGNITIDGKSLSGNESYGSGENILEIDGGVGNVEININ